MTDPLSDNFAALADPTRRAILARGSLTEPLQKAADWFNEYRHHWETELDALDSFLEKKHRKTR